MQFSTFPFLACLIKQWLEYICLQNVVSGINSLSRRTSASLLMKPAQTTTKVAWESWNEALLQKTEKLIISERMAQQELRRLDFSGNNFKLKKVQFNHFRNDVWSIMVPKIHLEEFREGWFLILT